MLGAIAGDIIGSVYESRRRTKSEDFPLFHPDCRFTDDSVLTIAVADAILQGGDYGGFLQQYARRYPHAGYGGFFREWIWQSDPLPYNSFGNGSAMRVSPVGWAFQTEEQVLEEAHRSATVTHNHPEGIKGAQAIALAVFLARRGATKNEIKREVQACCGYDLSGRLAEIRSNYVFDVTCQGTVPPALIAFFEAGSLEDAIRKAVSLGGDADTLAAMAGAVAEAYFRHIPDDILTRIYQLLPQDLLAVVELFTARYVRSAEG